MADTPILIIILALIYISSLLSIGVFLSYRSFKTKLLNLRVLGFAFIGFGVDFILIFLKAPSFLINIVVNTCFILMTIFTYTTFYKGRKRLGTIFIGAVILLRLIDCIARWNYNFTTPLASSLTDESRIYYYIFQLAVRGEFTIATGWLAYSSLTTYSNQRKMEDIEPWIQKRYFILGIGALVFLLQNLFVFLLPMDGTGYTSIQGMIVGILLLIVSIFFGACQLIGWIMPPKLKAYFNRDFQPKNSYQNINEDLTEEELMKQLMEDG
ncbi:hypothetical protein [Candidatus Lokiarchaeum ossiferum]|uniref:hypothetical protein n=1 Tax=Candidatus Lokiarchaeum ossiferum TaxID=2951803 RepID=UPI00352CD552